MVNDCRQVREPAIVVKSAFGSGKQTAQRCGAVMLIGRAIGLELVNADFGRRMSMGGGQNSSSGGHGEDVIAFGVLIESVSPELVQAPTAGDATQRQNVFCAWQGP